MRSVTYRKEATYALSRIPVNERRRIVAKVEQLAARPDELAHQVKKLKGRPGFRLRVGDWRVVFNDDGVVLDILAVGSRGSIYEP